jgi:hypothetical protein
MKLLGAALVFLTLFSVENAFAEIEILGSYSFATINPNDLNQLDKGNISPGYSSITSSSAVGGDLRYVFPVVSFLVGARYESWSAKASALGIDQTASNNRLAVLVGYRILDFGPYVGLIGSYGVSNSFKVTTTGLPDLTPASGQSYSLGVEGGVKLGPLMLGAELGYLSMIGTDMQSGTPPVSITINGAKSNLDMSGVYGKLELGVSL